MIKNLYRYDDDDVKAVRKMYQVDEDSIKRDLEILQIWVKQQRHLPKPLVGDDDQEKRFLEKFLLKNKFRVEKTKQKLDDYFSMKPLFRNYFQANNENLLPSKMTALCLPLPILHPDKSRIYICKLPPNAEAYSQDMFTRVFNLHMELTTIYDYSIGDTLIFDGKDFSMEHIKKLSIAEISANIQLALNVYSGRVCNVEAINAPPYVHLVLALLKVAMPKKLFDKIRIHENYGSFYERVPKKCLPKEYGGDLESIDEMMAKWDQVFKEHLDFFNERYHKISDETLRIGGSRNLGSFGVDGTFKKLNVD